MINIKTSKSYFNKNLNEILSKDNTEYNECILDVGVILFNIKSKNTDECNYDILNLVGYYNNVIKNLNDKIEILEQNYTKKAITDDDDKLISYIEEKYDDINSKLNFLENNNDDKIKTYMGDIYNKLSTNIYDYDKNINHNLSPVITKINDINTNFFKFFNKFDSGNVEKGNFGEKFIEQYLYDKFSSCSITDTHKSTSYGDMLFKFDKLNTMVESKNVINLKKDDINKFYKDVKIRTDNSEINSALFISLNECNLSDNRYFTFEIKNKIPIIFISNVFKNPELIRISIIILNYINKFISNFSNNICINNIVNDLESSIHLINKQFEYIETDKKLITKFQQNLTSKESDLDKLLKLILNTVHNNKIETNENIDNIDLSLESIVKILKEERNKNPHFKISINNMNNFNVSKYNIKKYGGIKKLNQLINEESTKDSVIIL